MYNPSDFEDTIPVYKFGDDGRVRNVRPTIYHRNAQAMYQKHGSQGRIGYIVENQYGDRKPMTFKQAERLKNLFERQILKVIDFWTVHHVDATLGMGGYDTEAVNSGIMTLPRFND